MGLSSNFKVDWKEMQLWVEEGAKRNPETKLEFFNNFPEDDIKELTKLLTILESETPILEEDGRWHEVITPKSHRQYERYWGARGYTFYNIITREKDRTISGFTGVSSSDTERPHRIEQELTGVLKEYRSRGLGKWLKAAMLLYIKENLSEKKFISAGNAEHNAPMLSINTRLGFKPYYKLSTYSFNLLDLQKKFQ